MATMRDLKQKVQQILENNRRNKDSFEYTVPSPDSYPYQWFWDSCFHSIMLSHFDIERAKNELRSLISKQFESGLIPHIIYWEKTNVLEVEWGTEGMSALTQPPIIAYAVFTIWSKERDAAFLREMYPALSKYYKYLLTRDLRKHHLSGIINPDESGEDNSPRFDPALGLPPDASTEEHNKRRFELFDKNRTCGFDAANCMRNFFWVKDVPFNSYLVENLRILAAIAHEVGAEEEHAYWYGEMELIKKAMRTYMLEDGIFWTIYGPDHTKVKVCTWAMFAPLAARICTQDEAVNLVTNYLKNPELFWSAYPVPTTAMKEKAFHPVESKFGPPWLHPNWRGPVWMASNWFVYRGLKNYGFYDEANHIKEKSIELIEQSGFREYFDPQTGVGMGAENFTWGGLVIDMN